MGNACLKRVCAAVLTSVFLPGALYGCGSDTAERTDEEPQRITIMTSASAGNSVTGDSPVKRRVEELTNTVLDIEFVPSETYLAEMNKVMASGNMPMVMYIEENSPSIITVSYTHLDVYKIQLLVWRMIPLRWIYSPM